jgi:hypothetical protein
MTALLRLSMSDEAQAYHLHQNAEENPEQFYQ